MNHTNTHSRLLIDTGDGQQPEYYENLHGALRDAAVKLSTIVLTHWHHDHVGGISGVVEKLGLGSSIPIYKYPLPGDAAGSDIGSGLSYSEMKNGHVFDVEGASLKAIFTPGHTTDHCILHLKVGMTA